MSDLKSDSDKLYKEFLENFPKFEPHVKRYYPRGVNSLIIYTKERGKFIFTKNEDGITLKSE